MSATLVDAIVRVVGERGSRSTIVSVIKSGSFIRSLCIKAGALVCQRYFLMMRLSFARDPETSLYQPSEYSSSPQMRQLNQ